MDNIKLPWYGKQWVLYLIRSVFWFCFLAMIFSIGNPRAWAFFGAMVFLFGLLTARQYFIAKAVIKQHPLYYLVEMKKFFENLPHDPEATRLYQERQETNRLENQPGAWGKALDQYDEEMKKLGMEPVDDLNIKFVHASFPGEDWE